MSEIPKGTVKLLDEEARLAALHRQKIASVCYDIEKLFIKEGLSMGDLLEIFGMFTARANKVFEGFTIKEISEKYDRT